mgnify:CR=1 FL=1
MQLAMLQNTAIRAFSTRFKPKTENFNALLVVYEAEKGQWRGFAYPYGETAEASSKKKTLGILRTLTDAYHYAIKRYNSPDHLVNGGLNNPMDKKVFNWVLSNKSFMDKIHSKIGKADSAYCYVETYRP